MKDIKALLDLRDGMFSTVAQLVKDKRFKDAYEVIRASSQPDEWILIGRSEVDMAEYKYNDIELIEAVMHRLFIWGYTINNVHTLNDKGKFATTAIVDVYYKFTGQAEYRHQGGAATSYCTDIKAITLATPKAVSQAKKNACKYIGKLLGLDLNREQEELPIVQVNEKQKAEDDIVTKELKEVTDAVNAAATKEEALRIINNSPFKLYPNLKELANKKQN